jgi:hypothetical protein
MLDVSDPASPRIKDVIKGEEIAEKLGLSAPHTVHCMPGDIVTISMLGDADGNSPGGFATLDGRDFSIDGRWEAEPGDLEFTYDFWYPPRQNTLVSSEWGAPNTFKDGFDPGDVAAGKYGRNLHFWDLEPSSPTGCTETSAITTSPTRAIRGSSRRSGWAACSAATRAIRKASGPLSGGPQMLQNSLDGERVYVSNSLYSTWDNQFYPELRGWLTKLDRQPDGSYALAEDFFVDFDEQTGGARPHEIHLPGGDCTTEIFQ